MTVTGQGFLLPLSALIICAGEELRLLLLIWLWQDKSLKIFGAPEKKATRAMFSF